MNAILDTVAHALPGGPGFKVWDAHTGSERNMWFLPVKCIEDSRGLRYCMMSKQAPAKIGGCPFCVVVGFGIHGTSVYLGAVTHLPPKDPIRLRWKVVFKRAHKSIQVLASSLKPEIMTHDMAVASGKRVQEGLAEQKDEAYKGVDVFTSRLPNQWKKTRQTIVDMAHSTLHFFQDALSLTADEGSMKMTRAKLMTEQKQGRFLSLQLFTKAG